MESDRMPAGKSGIEAFRVSERGFSYVGVLILLAIMGVVSATALQLGKVTHRRVAEEALLDIGREMSQALDSYRRVTPAGQPDAPLELKDLLKDNRFPEPVRHQRKIYADPLTGRFEWGLLRAEDSKRIIGVFSLSEEKPIKIANFDLRFQDFAGKSAFSQWVFRAPTESPLSIGAAARKGPASTQPALISPSTLNDEPENNRTVAPPPPAAPGEFISPMEALEE